MRTLSDPLQQIERPMRPDRPGGRRLLMPLTIGLLALSGFVAIKVGAPAIAALVRGMLTGDAPPEPPPFPLSGGWRDIDAHRLALSTKPSAPAAASDLTAVRPQEQIVSPRQVTPTAAMQPAALPADTSPAVRGGTMPPDHTPYPALLVAIAIDGAGGVPSAPVGSSSVASGSPPLSDSEPTVQVPRLDQDTVAVPPAETATPEPDESRSKPEITTVPPAASSVATPGTLQPPGGAIRARRHVPSVTRSRPAAPATADGPPFRPFSGITALSP